MSLTSQLKQPSSPVAQYVRFVGAIVAPTTRGAPMADLSARVLGLSELDLATAVSPVEGASPQMAGSAFDYRLRYQLAHCHSRDLVAYQGAWLLSGANPAATPVLERFFSSLDVLATALAPAGQDLDDQQERLLCSYCVVLAQLESVYRSAGQWRPDLPYSHPESSLAHDEPLLTLASKPLIADVMNLSRSASRVFSQLVTPVVNGSFRYEANPIFAGSVEIGGADADFIIGDALFELKTTKTLKTPAIREALLQMLGYVLLDYDDALAIRRLAVYFARQQLVAAWPLWQFAMPPASVLQHAVAGSEPTDDEIGERLITLRRLMRRAVAGEVFLYEAELSRQRLM